MEAYTWTDYQNLDDGQRWELIEGQLIAMSPAPSIRHQEVVVALASQLLERTNGSPCRVLVAPVDVKLSEQDVVQPDVLVICDESKVKETHIEGPPDLVIEVLSPSTQAQDRVRKLRLYAKSGVKEYWIVQPDARVVELLHLQGDRYLLESSYNGTDVLRSPSFPHWQIELKTIWG